MLHSLPLPVALKYSVTHHKMPPSRPHILLLTFPGQGHINPGLQLAKRLVGIGARVTFATTSGAQGRMVKRGIPDGLFFAAFSDGYDGAFNFNHGGIDQYMSELRRHGPESLAELIVSHGDSDHPFTCVIYSILLPWVAKVARQYHLPLIFLWNQPTTVLDIYYHYFHGYKDTIEKHIDDPTSLVKLPGLPSLAVSDLPSFLKPPNTHPWALELTKEQLDILDEESNPKVFVNTFDELEREALKSIDKYKLVGVGPLIPSAFLDGKDPSDTSFGGDLIFQSSRDYIEWLNSKPQSSVIYISFGSISILSKPQMEEMARALLDIGHPFLWVIRIIRDEDKPSCMEELEKQGIMVPWCSQVEVLSHPSLGCFVTHCGWNSTFESLASGVPLVAFPQWTDQLTNAKLVEDVWKTGVRARARANEEGIVKADEIIKCLELVMGGGKRAEEMRQNARKWKELAREACREDGSSDRNLKAFVDEVGALVHVHEVGN